jgi:hypothetical protein
MLIIWGGKKPVAILVDIFHLTPGSPSAFVHGICAPSCGQPGINKREKGYLMVLEATDDDN